MCPFKRLNAFNAAITARGHNPPTTVSADYSTPVTVNGFSCKNCTDVDYAKKHIDPAHPKSGPYGIDAKDDPTVKKTADFAAVTYGGTLSEGDVKRASGQSAFGPAPGTIAGAQLDISA